MRIPHSLCAVALAAVAFLAPARAQIQTFGGPDEDRMASTLIFADTSGGTFSPKGALSISYSQPDWQDKYTKVLESGKFNGTNQRLGKNWWTSFDTMTALEIGGTKIAAGTYYLGIHVDKEGKLHLMVIDTKTAITKGWTPFMPDSGRPRRCAR